MPNQFKTIARFNYSAEAQIIKGRLEAEGITVYLADQHTIDTDPLISNAIGGVKLQVESSQVFEAKQILNSISPYSLNNNGELITCPNCKNETVELFSTINSFKSLMAFLVGFLFGTLPFHARYQYKCETCNKEFNTQ
jgi:hypothetical protein